ncbi:MAG: class I SAM-dependent methyltransferase [Thermoanaerobaculaceae bacterium]|jgi:predicted O-methyltransferase YrrM|nr:class I SAM-dependent methyltransferase [Thermoanaerobaculaceae bacterium]
MIWESDTKLVLDGAVVELDWTEGGLARLCGPDRFVLQKTREMVSYYASLAGSRCQRVLEAGILRGGSVVLLDQLLQPQHLVAFDLSPQRLPDLDAYLLHRGAAERVRLHFGVDQSDTRTLRRLILAEFGQEPLDLVIDDASHLLPETRATFNTVFPHLRPGGLYVIEDWGWAHWPGTWQDQGGPWARHPSLTQLVLELVMTSASRPDVVTDVLVRRDIVTVTRGPAVLPEGFDISRSYLTAGRRFAEEPRRDHGSRFPLPQVLRRAQWVWRHEGARGIARRVAKRLGL